MKFNFATVPNIIVGPDASLELAGHLKRLGVSKPLIVTDNGVLAVPSFEDMKRNLSQNKIDFTVFSDVIADPPDHVVINASQTALDAGCDGVVGFGGGSPMDVAKLVATLLLEKQDLAAIFGVDKITSSRRPLIQIPTTAGTGSEATGVAIITTGTHTKAAVVSEVLLADLIILDANLTRGLPAATTAATGIDAMVHAVEAFTSKRLKNPISDMLALKALSLMALSIVSAVNDGNDFTARQNMLLGAMYAGQAFANAPVGAVHALAYPLGGIYHIPHGLSNSLVLPHVLRFNAPAAQSDYSEILRSMGIECASQQAGECLADYFQQLAISLGIPTRLREMNIKQSDLLGLAEQAMLQQRLLINNPREVNQQQALEIYQQAF